MFKHVNTEDFTKRDFEQVARLQEIYDISEEEASELHFFDKYHTGSDKATREYLQEYHGMSAQEIEDIFYKKPAPKKENRTLIRRATKAAQDRRKERLDYLEKALGELDIFGKPVERSNTSIYFEAPETGNGITVKFTRHKTQRVVSRDWEPAENAPYAQKLVNERILALHKAIADAPELFEAPSFAKTQVGIVDRDDRYPFASIKITHHKS